MSLYSGVGKTRVPNVELVLGFTENRQSYIISAFSEISSSTYKLATAVSTLQTLPYPYLTTAQQVKVSSTSNSDSSSGTGCRSILIAGMDANYNIIEELVILNGQTPVTTVNSFYRVFEFTAVAFGSDRDSYGDPKYAGIVYVGYGTITSGVPQYKLAGATGSDPNTKQGIGTIQSDSLGVIKGLYASTNTDNSKVNTLTDVLICFRPFGQPAWYKVTPHYISTSINNENVTPFVIPPLCDIEIRVANDGVKTQKISVGLNIDNIKLKELFG